MSLGISAGGWAALGGAALGAVSGSKGGGSQTVTNEIDPRLAAYIYGQEGDGGFMKDLSTWYQANRSGMNDQMAQGLNTQWGVFNDPGTMAGYQQISSLGSGLMGAPVMGNPFSDGRASLGGGGNNLGLGSGPTQQPQQAQQPQQFPSYQRAPGTITVSSPGPFSSALPQWLEKPPAQEEAPYNDATMPAWAKGQKPDQYGQIFNPTDGSAWVKGLGNYWQEGGANANAHSGG